MRVESTSSLEYKYHNNNNKFYNALGICVQYY